MGQITGTSGTTGSWRVRAGNNNSKTVTSQNNAKAELKDNRKEIAKDLKKLSTNEQIQQRQEAADKKAEIFEGTGQNTSSGIKPDNAPTQRRFNPEAVGVSTFGGDDPVKSEAPPKKRPGISWRKASAQNQLERKLGIKE